MDVTEKQQILTAISTMIAVNCNVKARFSILCTGGNVLVDDTGQKVKLADFGTTTRCDSYLKDNSPRGTEPFMAPEVNMNCFWCVVR